MTSKTRTPLTQIRIGASDLNNEIRNSFEESFHLPTQTLALKAASLANYLPMSDEARGIMAAIAERLAITQSVKPVPYTGEIYKVSWIVARNAWCVRIPEQAVELLAKQTPDKSFNFWQQLVSQVERVVGEHELREGDACRLEVKADFSDWRVFMSVTGERFKQIYSNGHVGYFNARRIGSAKPGQQVQFHFWHTHENVDSVNIHEQDQTIEYIFRPLDLVSYARKPGALSESEQLREKALESHWHQVLPLKLMDPVQVPEPEPKQNSTESPSSN